MDFNYDVIVVGGGHAGCEAAMASANLGCRTLLVSMDMTKFAQMSCNPAIGGIAKGQIVREIDALGGYTGIVTDASTLQFRMLNRSKGPAMWSPRAQCDKLQYSEIWRKILETHSLLDIYQDTVVDFLFDNLKIVGVRTTTGAIFNSQAVILTAGTFLTGKLFIGQNSFEGGRIGEMSSYGLTEQLKSMGIATARMKTGTPPRIDITSIDTSEMIIQDGDYTPEKFSYLPYLSSVQYPSSKQMPCYIVHTNQEVHDILKSGFDQSPLFTGKIKGIGPRYCPSIEDKLRTFSDKTEHQLFLEPEGRNTNEYYLQGFSSSLPLNIQIKALHKIKGFKNVKIYRPAYAVEYDYFDPTQLNATLELKSIENLYFAGQINGTTGYEEAAAQGLMAGINAALKIKGKDPFILHRDQAYIGVLIDDLITKGVDEPYRMFTSRAEYRILLRQDNADFRLTELSYKIGLADKFRYDYTMIKYDNVSKIENLTTTTSLKPDDINSYLREVNTSEIENRKRISDLISRPQINLKNFINNVPCGTLNKIGLSKIIDNIQIGEEYDYIDKKNLNYINTNKDQLKLEIEKNFRNQILDIVDIQIKYKGYIEREKLLAEKILRLENLIIPDNFDFDKLESLSIESRQKLKRYAPKTIAQASRISGVSPADISILLVYFGR